MDLQQMLADSDGPVDAKAIRGKPLFKAGDEPTLLGIADKLIQAANIIVDHRIAIALGLETNSNAIFYNAPETEWILSQVAPMLKAMQQTKKIKADHMKDITKLIGKGKISLTEAKDLMEVVSQMTTLELLDEIK